VPPRAGSRRRVCLPVGVLTALTASGIAAETNCGAVLTRSELIAEIAAANPSLRHEDIATVVATIFNEIGSALARGDRVELRGFGAFTARRRAAPRGWAAIQEMVKPSRWTRNLPLSSGPARCCGCAWTQTKRRKDVRDRTPRRKIP
jgi:hypothetical protein